MRRPCRTSTADRWPSRPRPFIHRRNPFAEDTPCPALPAALGALLAGLTPITRADAQQNVALGRPVTLVGTFGVLRPGSEWAPAPAPAAAATVVDGVFLPAATTWTQGTVWW